MNMLNRAAMLFTLLALTACGGGAGTSPAEPTVAAAQCDPNDPATAAECGTVYIGLTDADGDFLNYTVDVVSLSLQTANGRVVELLPQQTRINFSDYVELTELLAARSLPPATYVSGTITLDYSNAEVFVEADGEAKEALVLDMDGNPVTQTALSIQLAERERLVITRGRIGFLQLDFDLDASHTVDILPTPAAAHSEPFIVAEVSPVDEKNIRVRGPLGSVNATESHYTVAVRPFHDRNGDFGRARVYITDDTEFEVDGEMYMGSDGLRALDVAGQGVATVAAGTVDVADRVFTASIVLAGSSVPGIDRDAVFGNVIARSGNLLTVRGATIIPSDRHAHFHDDVIVEVGPETKVFRDGSRTGTAGSEAISVGQRITVRGDLPDAATSASSAQLHFDATQGSARLHLTRLSGIVNTVMPGQTDITLHAIDRRRSGIFDFAGTGPSSDLDANADNYEIETGNLTLAAFSEGKPIVAFGYPNAFGMAPPDFSGRTVIDFSEVRSALGIGWGANGTVAPFISMDSSGLLLSNQNGDIDVRHHIKQGPVLIDLQALNSDTLLVPADAGRTLFSIKSGDSIRLYTQFDDFVSDLSNSLDGATTARAMHASGTFDRNSNLFTATKMAVFLLPPQQN